MRYAIGIVTFNPDELQLRACISSLLTNKSADCMIIADNHSSCQDFLSQITNGDSRFVLIKNADNTGMAHALNQICEKAIQLGYEWVATLDQDSVMQPHMLDHLIPYTQQTDLGIICPRIEDRNLGRQHTKNDQGTEYINYCITAGNLVRLEAWKKVGGFSEELFIDGVDFDFCLNLQNNGFRILRVNDVYLTQEIGHGHRISLPFHRQISILNHSPLRLYYITRNYLYIGRKYHQKWHWTWEVLKRVLIVICYEGNKRQKIQYILTGIRHYRKGRMGNYDR